MNVTIIFEPCADGSYWARINTADMLLTTQGNTKDAATTNILFLVKDFLENEGATKPQWEGIALSAITFHQVFDLTQFFDSIKEVKLSELSKEAKINASLLRQYACGNKYPSIERCREIEAALHKIGARLKNLQIV